MTSHQDLKQVIATTSYDKSVLNSELVPKTDVLDANDSFAFAYSPTLPSFFPTVFYFYKKCDINKFVYYREIIQLILSFKM